MRMVVCLDARQEEPCGTPLLLCLAGHHMLCQGGGRNLRWGRYPACLKVVDWDSGEVYYSLNSNGHMIDVVIQVIIY